MRSRSVPGSAAPVLQTIILLMITAGSPAAAEALHDHDNGPLTGIFGLPDSTEGALLLDEGAGAWGVLLLTASHSIADQAAGETLILDGETTRVEFSYRRAVSSRLEIGLELPYLWHESGSLDSVIDDWHDFFGFPDGARASRPRDVLEFYYEDASGVRVLVDENSRGIGDLRLFAGWQLLGERHATALRFGVKLPTGSADDLHGSGGTDVSVGFAGDVSRLWGHERLSGFYRLNATYLGEPDWLADKYNDVVGQLSAGLEFAVSQGFALDLQGAYRSAVFDAPIENLGDQSVAVTFGGRFRLGERWRLALAVSEDLKVGSAPDVSFQVGLQYSPD